jgi:hypothetical protein
MADKDSVEDVNEALHGVIGNLQIKKQFVKDFNDGMKTGNLIKCQEELNAFCTRFCPEFELMPHKLRPGMVCLFAHSRNSKRALGVIMPCPEKEMAVPKAFRFQFSTLVVKEKTVKHEVNGVKRRKTVLQVVEGTKNPENLITPKRGCWFIWTPSLEKGIYFHSIEDYKSTLIQWYQNYIVGMERDAPGDLPRVREHYGFEQFMLENYPTPKWRAFMGKYKKHNQKRVRFIDPSKLPLPGPSLIPPPPPPLAGSAANEPPPAEEEEDYDESSDGDDIESALSEDVQEFLQKTIKEQGRKRRKAEKAPKEEEVSEPLAVSAADVEYFNNMMMRQGSTDDEYDDNDLSVLIQNGSIVDQHGDLVFIAEDSALITPDSPLSADPESLFI